MMSKIKKCAIVAAVVAVLTVLLCISASAATTYTEGNYTYTVTDGKATITSVSTGVSGDVTIPSTLGGYPVTNVGYRAFYKCSSMTSVTIPDGVTSIGDQAFYNCSSLTSVTIGNSVTSIGSRAFYNCSSLTGVTIPDSVTTIGSSAFFGCSNLTSVTIPDSVTSVGNSAFSGCSSLTSITIPNSVTSIGNSAFSGCSKLTIYAEAVSQPAGWNANWNYSNRPVIWGYVPPIGETVTGYTLTLQGSSGGDIGISLKMTLSDELLADGGAYINVVINGVESKISFSELSYDRTSGKYSLKSAVAAKNMNDIISATVYNGEGECGPSYNYSIMGYCEQIISEYADIYPELVPMTKSMLNYGAMAQKYFGYSTDSLANANLSAADGQETIDAVTAIDVEDATFNGTMESVGIAKHSASIVLGSETTIKHYITLSDGESIDNYIVSVNGAEATPVPDGNRYVVTIANIPAASLDTGYTLSVTRKSDSAVYTASYSAMNYVEAMFNACKDKAEYTDLCNLLKAIYLYNDAANTYFGK